MKLLWLDLETTGLDEPRDFILEVAAVVTDERLNDLATFHRIVNHPLALITARMPDYVYQMHLDSELLRDTQDPTAQSHLSVERDLHLFLDEHFRNGTTPPMPILAGNTISFDRRFLKQHMPTIESRLHYRQLDVSSWKIMFESRYNWHFEKKKAHRALADIRESIAELKFYLDQIEKGCCG